jgi:selenocysteine-specific elongation factor
MTVIATAGHVDHGKSTLVRSLTGTDPDRLAEEKARGLTIDLGFANLTLPSGDELSFIDVPGHIRFLRNMLAGVGAVEGCLFVVAATEGWKPQSEEHLRILDLLGIRHGVVALTKVDQVDDDLLELAQLDVAEHVEGTFLEDAPVIPVAATEGVGLGDLAVALDGLVDRMGEPADTGRPRLWVDRAFAPAGAGTVVTGTLTGGAIAVNDSLAVLPGRGEARVRGLQSHHRDATEVPAGNRVAVNLTGISHHDVGRGSVIVRAEQWHQTRMLDAELRVLPSLDHEVSRRGAYAVYFGSGEFPARVRVLGPSTLAPGSTGNVRIYLDRVLPLLPGDRFILRESGRDETIGGGEILDVEPMLPASKASPDRSIERLVIERGWVAADHLARLVGHEVEATVEGWVVAPEALEAMQQDLLHRIENADALGLDLASLDDRERAAIESVEGVEISAGRATIGTPEDPLADHPWLALLEAEPFTPPPPDGFDRAEVRELVRRGTVIEQDGVFFAKSAVDRAARLVAGRLATSDGITVADARDLLGTSRKYVLPMLNHFDQNGITRRRDDLRIAGPRLPSP